MSGDLDVDDGYDGHVIVTFTVISAARIDGLAPYLDEARKPTPEFFYDLGTTTFDELKAKPRADKLDATINDFIDKVERIPRDLLHDPGTFVRLFMTLCRGAETIHAPTLQRLADVNATIWIDA